MNTIQMAFCKILSDITVIEFTYRLDPESICHKFYKYQTLQFASFAGNVLICFKKF